MAYLFIGIIKFYQKFISPFFPSTCRFQPTCSSYTIEALEKFGAVRGGMMALARILRCHPFSESGEDPVPDHFTLKRQKAAE